SESSGCTTTRSGSKNCDTPRPSQPGQAPTGELNENRRGSSSGSAYSHTGQLYFDENSIGSAASSSSDCTVAIPSPSLSAVSNDSARRCLMSSRTLKRSITASMVCLTRSASGGTASISCSTPSTRT